MTRELTCIVCPRGCTLTVELEGKEVKSVTGQGCRRGEAYAKDECIAPMRTLTTTAPLVGGGVVPVKTDRAVPKESLCACMEQINRLRVPRGLPAGSVVLARILDTDANVILTRES